MLNQSGYVEEETWFLVDGLTNGFDLEYHGPENRQDSSSNIPFMIGDKYEMWLKIMKEVSLGCYAGPFEEIPYKWYVQSPIGLVPKAGNKTRLIFHLSFNFKSGFSSVNAYTPKDKCTVKYHDLDEAIRKSLMLLESLKSSGVIWYGKTDVQLAFRLLPTKLSLWWLMVMKAQHPITNQWFFFIDKCLAFGHSISCALFQGFSNSLAHLSKARRNPRMKLSTDLTNYLDDFLFLALSQMACNEML